MLFEIFKSFEKDVVAQVAHQHGQQRNAAHLSGLAKEKHDNGEDDPQDASVADGSQGHQKLAQERVPDGVLEPEHDALVDMIDRLQQRKTSHLPPLA